MRYSITLLFLFLKFNFLIAQTQSINSNNGTVQQNNGSYNTNIGSLKVYHIKNTGTTKPNYTTLKITANTKSIVYKDGVVLGTILVHKPLKINLKKGVHRLRISSAFYKNYSLEYEFKVSDEQFDSESYFDCKFKIGENLYPISIPNDIGQLHSYGYLNIKTKEMTISTKFEYARPFSEGLASVKIDGKFGFIDELGNIVIENKYNEVEDFKDGISTVELNKRICIIDSTGKELSPFLNVIKIGNFYGGYAIVEDRDTDKMGIITKNGEFVIKPEYTTFIGTLKNSTLKAGKGGQKILNISDDVFMQKGGKWGLVSDSGQTILPAVYDDVLYKYQPHFAENIGTVFGVKLNGVWKFIKGNNGELFKSVDYDEIYDSENLNMIVGKNKKFGLIDYSYNEVIPLKYDGIDSKQKGYVVVDSMDLSALFDRYGKQLTKFKYDDIGDFWNDLAPVKLNDKYALINKSGREITEFNYDDIEGYEKNKLFYGCYVAIINNKYGLLNNEGKEITKFIYDEIQFSDLNHHKSFGENLGDSIGLVKLNNKWGYIDNNGKLVSPIIYDSVNFFELEKHNVAIIKLNNKFGIIDRNGKILVIPDKYTNANYYWDKLIKMENDNKCTYFDFSGECVFGCK